MEMVSSVVIHRWHPGWVAYLRFKNPKYDANISCTNKYLLYRLVESHMFKVKAREDASRTSNNVLTRVG